jgi:daunosaminyl-N,N-dimethyltransferase/N-dimethyltransferase
MSMSMSMKQRLYTDRAELYDAIYASKPYALEAARLRELLSHFGVADGARVLEAACGTGAYLRELRAWYQLSGFDLNEAVLDIARRKVPGVPLQVADLRDFTVEVKVDAALCLFSSFAYLHSEEARASSLASFAAAVRPGGVLIIEPFVAPADFQEGASFVQVHDGPELKCARASVSRRRGEFAVIEFGWLVVRRGSDAIEHFQETHELALIEPGSLRRAVEAAGFDVLVVPDRLAIDRALLVGVRRV